MTRRRRANFYLDRELLDGLKVLKARVGIPESEAVRRAVAEYLERQGVTSKRTAERKQAGRRPQTPVVGIGQTDRRGGWTPRRP